MPGAFSVFGTVGWKVMKNAKAPDCRGVPFSSAVNIGLQALQALGDNRLRTVLSILGIAVGIAAVMAVSAVSKGGRHLVFAELQTFGLQSIWVFREPDDKDPRKAVRLGTGIENSDFETLKDTPHLAIDKLSPLVYARGKALPVRYEGRYSDANIIGVSSDYLAIDNDTLQRGRPLREEDIAKNRPVAIIGPEVYQDLFKKESDPIGRSIRIGTKSVTVIGLLAEKNRDFLASIGSAGGNNANDRILLPYRYLQEMIGKKEINVLQAETTGLADTDAAVYQLKEFLRHRHGNRFSYKAQTMAQYITTTEKILQGVTIIGIVAASVSLFVGGMGIMNIMTTSVVERTREIGIRKALGASRGDILGQFLCEAVLISLIGGLLGLLLGLAAGFGLALLVKMPMTPSPLAIAVALTVSVVVGLLSGYYPAFRAANLQPVEALRYE